MAEFSGTDLRSRIPATRGPTSLLLFDMYIARDLALLPVATRCQSLASGCGRLRPTGNGPLDSYKARSHTCCVVQTPVVLPLRRPSPVQPDSREQRRDVITCTCEYIHTYIGAHSPRSHYVHSMYVPDTCIYIDGMDEYVHRIRIKLWRQHQDRSAALACHFRPIYVHMYVRTCTRTYNKPAASQSP